MSACLVASSRTWWVTKNGDLLRAAAGLVDAFVTIDSNLAYQLKLQVGVSRAA